MIRFVLLWVFCLLQKTVSNRGGGGEMVSLALKKRSISIAHGAPSIELINSTPIARDSYNFLSLL
jgi:hypothetical protein